MTTYIWPVDNVSVTIPDAATETTQLLNLAQLQAINTNTDGIEGKLDTLNGKDFATQTTLAALNGKVTACDTTNLATSANQSTLITNTNFANRNALVKVAYDYISANYAGATADVWTYKTGGSGGTTVATLTINYTDATKATISNVGVV